MFQRLYKCIGNNKRVATDGIAYAMREWVEQLSEKDYDAFVKWYFLTC